MDVSVCVWGVKGLGIFNFWGWIYRLDFWFLKVFFWVKFYFFIFICWVVLESIILRRFLYFFLVYIWRFCV